MTFLIVMLDTGGVHRTKEVPEHYLENCKEGFLEIINTDDMTYYCCVEEDWMPIPEVEIEPPDDSHNEGF